MLFLFFNKKHCLHTDISQRLIKKTRLTKQKPWDSVQIFSWGKGSSLYNLLKIKAFIPEQPKA